MSRPLKPEDRVTQYLRLCLTSRNYKIHIATVGLTK